jgi:protein-L-isoaspartate(D-aspartate) O-methyltransferase
MPSARTLRRELVATLERRGCIRSAAVRRAFSTVPRELFVSEVARREGLERVYTDTALVTRISTHGTPLSSSSQAAIMAEMLEHLDLRRGLRVLEIGTGTGYNAALLWKLVAPSGTVTSVELEADLAAAAESALRAGGYPVRVVVGDAHTVVDGERGPFDRIVLTASSDHVPRPWRDALVDGGLLELPLRLPGSAEGEQLVVIMRRQGDALRSVALIPGGFMNLRRPGREELPPRPAASVSVSEFVDGKGRSIASVSGAGLAALRPSARRRLAAVMLSRPRLRRVSAPTPAAASLVAYVAMADPPDGVTVRTFRPEPDGHYRAGAGVASPDGRGLALTVGRPDRRGCRIEVYGEGPGAARAERSLDELVRQWRKAGRPSLADCQITVTYGVAPTAAGVQVANHDGCFTALRWPS